MEVTATQFRQNIYKLLDKVLKSGEPLVITRKGKKFKIISEEKPQSKNILEKLEKRDTIAGDPDDLWNIDWSKEWNPEDNI